MAPTVGHTLKYLVGPYNIIIIYHPLLLLKYGVTYRNQTSNGGPGHRRKRVRFGRLRLALNKIGYLDGHTAVLIIQGIQYFDTFPPSSLSSVSGAA
jgi:hypothetical protein